MDAHLIDSQIYGHNWSTSLSRSVFSERARIERWSLILKALARAQATHGIIPPAAAEEIQAIDGSSLSIDRIAARTRETSHSTLGLIDVLRGELSESAGQFVYFGTTVQDLTDTSMALEAKRIGEAVIADLRVIEDRLLTLATQYAETPMTGRTHGQPGSPITFGFKVATWVDEVGRRAAHLQTATDEIATGQLGGAVGTLGFFGDQAMALRATYCELLGLHEPDISWLTSRDRVAQFATTLSLACSTLARIANEVYSLQRGELAELAEARTDGTVGSITMPQKRNPESSEQIVTLSRLIRAQADVMTEGMVVEHERDARGWKAEWVALPSLCHYGTAAVQFARELVEGLEVNAEAMMHNLGRSGAAGSERLLALLGQIVGKHDAQALLQEANVAAGRSGLHLAVEIAHRMPDGVGDELVGELTTVDTGSSRAMVEVVAARAAARRSVVRGNTSR